MNDWYFPFVVIKFAIIFMKFKIQKKLSHLLKWYSVKFSRENISPNCPLVFSPSLNLRSIALYFLQIILVTAKQAKEAKKKNCQLFDNPIPMTIDYVVHRGQSRWVYFPQNDRKKKKKQNKTANITLEDTQLIVENFPPTQHWNQASQCPRSVCRKNFVNFPSKIFPSFPFPLGDWE